MKGLFDGLLAQLGAEQPKIESLEDLKKQPKQLFSEAGAAVVAKIMDELAVGLKGKDLNPADFDHVMGISARSDEIGKLMLEGSAQINAVAQLFLGGLAEKGVKSMVTEEDEGVTINLNLDPADLAIIMSLDANKAKLQSAFAGYTAHSDRIFSMDSIRGFCDNAATPYEQKMVLLNSEIDGLKALLGFSSEMMDYLSGVAQDGNIITKEIIADYLEEGVDFPSSISGFQDQLDIANDAVQKVQDKWLHKLSQLLFIKKQVEAGR